MNIQTTDSSVQHVSGFPEESPTTKIAAIGCVSIHHRRTSVEPLPI